MWTKVLVVSGFHYRDGNYSTKDIIWGGKIFSQPRSCASPDQLHLPGVPHSQEHPQRLRSLPLGCQGEEHEKHNSCWRLTARLPSPIQSGRPCWQWSAISSSSSTPPPIPSSTSWRSEELQCFPSFFQSFQGVSLRIPSSDLVSWNTSWVVVLSVPQSRLCKRLKDFLSKKKGFSGWGEWDSCERVQEAESFRPC